MTTVIKRSKIAAAVVGVMALTGTSVALASNTSLSQLQSEQMQTSRASAASQERIDSLFEQSRELLGEYRSVVAQYESLKLYNDHVQRLVDDQNNTLESLQRQIDGIEETRQGVVPLMYKMIDALDEFVQLDIPIHREQRERRVERLRDIMARSNVQDSEKFRQIVEAYQIEMDYGVGLVAYQGTLTYGGQDIAVDYFHMGRVAFMAQSLDMRNAWLWDNDNREWMRVEDSFLSPLTQAIRMSRRQTAYDVVRLPIFAAETAE
ncbi:DUF3450 domain-containing protein [Aliidiomarina halalkaliphila]|uniref:DUF3450 domain-containing protein n=1 Tax=Aliidiomarina halalkaliphila TaxID=2593535 RepID=A0A552X579_9GAMM|nr:DUF3450 domain-containing protein [Aliidiomarina halalkaliphila]TRW50126.1 DUF3450 domain-containing protein [Aliidiomarina halalkaliphila]